MKDVGHGLSLFGIFDLSSLPADVLASLERCDADVLRYRQLFLFGHVGRAMWDAVTTSGIESADPIDDFSVRVVDAHFETEHPGAARRLLYPGAPFPVSLQALGELAGVHHASPFMVGIDARWGSWFAYRAVVVADTNVPPTIATKARSPCDACAHRVCVSSCPAGALDAGHFELGACVAYRRRVDSLCKLTCLARTSCPVGEEHRYEEAQLQHHYGRSMQTIDSYFAERDETR